MKKRRTNRYIRIDDDHHSSSIPNQSPTLQMCAIRKHRERERDREKHAGLYNHWQNKYINEHVMLSTRK